MGPIEFAMIGMLVFGAFWLYTLYAILSNDRLNSTSKLIWALVITVVPLVGCILYFVLPDKQLKV